MTVVKRTKRAKPDPELVKLADSLLINYKKPEDLIGENGLLKQLTKMLVERALEAEMTGRGRDGSYLPPPAQIRTCGTTAYGSCLGYVTRSGPQGTDVHFWV